MITKQAILNIFQINDLLDLPNAVMNLINGAQARRDSIYKELLKLANYDLSYDWFQNIYEEELSQRKQKKQDFTPSSLGELAAAICGECSRSTYEPTAGNGSMLIADWDVKRRKAFPWEFLPSQNQFECWELSDRSIPILLLNLSIRGMMGTVYHGDVLEKKIIQKYILLNKHDDALAFSEVHQVNNNAIIIQK